MRNSIEKWKKSGIRLSERGVLYAATVECRNRTKGHFTSMAAQDMTLNTVTCV